MESQNRFYVYALCEPAENFSARYVGVTSSPRARFAAHLWKSNNKSVLAWIGAGVIPRMVILDTIHTDARFFIRGLQEERWWIRHLLRQGHDLMNQIDRTDWRIDVHHQNIRRMTAAYMRHIFTATYWHNQKRGIGRNVVNWYRRMKEEIAARRSA